MADQGLTTEHQRVIDELLAARDDLARVHLEAGAREERQRITEEIHDTLAQEFTSVVLAARRARHALNTEDLAATLGEIDHIEELGRAGVDAARRLMSYLAPLELDGRPLRAALALLAVEDPRPGDPIVGVRVDGDDHALPGDVESAILRIAQEAVTNARRHAHAKRVVVTVTYQGATVGLDVVDDGRGFDAEGSGRRGFGLTNMRKRAERLGGTFHLDSEPGIGSTINATIPVTPLQARS